MTGLQTVRVSKDDLLEKIRDNREMHRARFVEGIEKYRAAVIKELEEWLELALAGKQVQRQSVLVQPQDHTADYDAVIAQLEMSLDEDLEIQHTEFRQFVLDEWSWMAQFTDSIASAAAYLRQ